MIVTTDTLKDRPLNQSYYTGISHVYAGEYPGDKYGEKAETKIRQMHHFGVRHLIDLTEEGELNPYAHLLPADCTHTRFPIRDVSIPDNVDKVCRLIGEIMDLSKRDDGYVYIHCWGGVGRTGTIVGCLLAEDMETPTFDAVMKRLRGQFLEMPKSAHRVTPETKEQETFIKKYIEGILARRNQCKERVKDRVRGSLMAGAAGDALGYPVEFMSKKAILSRYGSKGITRFELDRDGKAIVSDDTQMTLFTANGLLFGVTRWCTHGMMAPMKSLLTYAYQDWLQTQIGVEDYNDRHYCWIRDIKELNVRRAPGNTCLSALMSIKHHREVDNDSKGCGGVMRVAPVGLMAAADQQVMVKDWNGEVVPRCKWTGKEVARLGGDCAEITHKHPLGYLPAAFMADLVYYILMFDGPITFRILERFLGAVYADMKSEYATPSELMALDELWMLIEKAVSLAGDNTVSDEFAIPHLGEGWTGDEALAIAIYCTMKHLESFEDALSVAVNHDGDSDSTGAICGNLMGAIIGYDAIPQHFKQKLELKELIIDMADDIVSGCTINDYHSPETPEEKQWEKRYVKIEPVNPKRFSSVFSFLNTEYHIMPQAQKVMEINKLFDQLGEEEYDEKKCKIAYKIALKVFDTETFDPFHPLEYKQPSYEPQNYFIERERDSMPACTYWFVGDEPIEFSQGVLQTIRINTQCFEGEKPVIAIRKKGTQPMRIQCHGGLKPFYDKIMKDKYPDWELFTVDWQKFHYVFITHNLKKEFVVEIAHLWEDGTLHRIYHLCY